tara:strand:+ start:15923 stop:16438 length:516 start_codon:yes stop_codon:yes gene_type:complete
MELIFDFSYSSLLKVAVCATGIYLAVILFTRIAGKRSFSKMSSFDFAMTVAIGSIIATTVLTSSVSLIEGTAGLAMVYMLQIFAALMRRFSFFRRAIDNSPMLLMDGDTILEENLRKARVTKGDLRSKLREANVLHRSQIKAVVFETTGNISVLHGEGQEVEEWLLKEVSR